MFFRYAKIELNTVTSRYIEKWSVFFSFRAPGFLDARTNSGIFLPPVPVLRTHRDRCSRQGTSEGLCSWSPRRGSPRSCSARFQIRPSERTPCRKSDSAWPGDCPLLLPPRGPQKFSPHTGNQALPYSRISKNTGSFQGISVPDRRRSGKAHGLHKVIGLLQELYQIS